jgi:hypothetical protein
MRRVADGDDALVMPLPEYIFLQGNKNRGYLPVKKVSELQAGCDVIVLCLLEHLIMVLLGVLGDVVPM